MFVEKPLGGSPAFKDGRGAEGYRHWFKPVRVEVFASAMEESMTLAFASNRGIPISVNLSRDDMLAVGELIVEACGVAK